MVRNSRSGQCRWSWPRPDRIRLGTPAGGPRIGVRAGGTCGDFGRCPWIRANIASVAAARREWRGPDRSCVAGERGRRRSAGAAHAGDGHGRHDPPDRAKDLRLCRWRRRFPGQREQQWCACPVLRHARCRRLHRVVNADRGRPQLGDAELCRYARGAYPAARGGAQRGGGSCTTSRCLRCPQNCLASWKRPTR